MSSDAEEQLAEQVVLNELGGTVIQRDDQSQPSMVDLIIETAGQQRVAVEVTTLTPELSARFHAECLRLGGPYDSLGRTWTVRFLRSVKIKNKKVAESILALLRDLEAADKSHVDVNNWTENDQPFVDRLRSLGGVEVTSVEGPGWILFVNRTIGTAASSGEILTEVAINILNDPKRDDNARKLTATDLEHRQLFIIVSRHAGPVRIAVEQALQQGFLPSAHPSASDDYTGVWIAVNDSLPTAYWTRQSGWKMLAP